MRCEIYMQDRKMTSDDFKNNPHYFDGVLIDGRLGNVKKRLTIILNSQDLYFELEGGEDAVEDNIRNIESQLPIKLKLFDKSKSN